MGVVRWCTSIVPLPARSPMRYSMQSGPSTRRPTRRFTGEPTNWQKKQPMRTKVPEQQSPVSSVRARRTSCSPKTRRKASTSPRTPSATLRRRLRKGGVVDPRLVLTPESSVVVTEMEHHANLIPWQELCAKTGAQLRWIGLTEDGRLDMDQLSVIDHTTAAVSIVHQSNILGTINPVRSIMDRAREVGALGIVDACQSIPHMRVNVEDLGADLLTWSGHKMLGPTGIGLLWGRSDVLNSLPPFLAGGSMIESVTMEGSTFAPAPQRFEAGVPMVAQAVGLEAAVRYLDGVGIEAIEQHEHELTAHALATLTQMPGVRVIGPESTVDRGSAISFVVDGLHPHDVGQVLDDRGVAVRVGHHCAWPTCRRYGVPATTRLSTYLYNDLDDIDAAAAGVRAAQEFFGVV